MDTYADEGWRTNYWHRCHVLAQIRQDQNLDWYFRLLSMVRKNPPDKKEYKSDVTVKILKALGKEHQGTIWNTLQEVMITIYEPKQFIRELGVEIERDYSYKVRINGKSLLIKPADRDVYCALDDRLKNAISELILSSSPIISVGNSFSQLAVVPRKEDFFSSENILSMINQKDSKKKVIGAIKLASRLFIAFFEVIDPGTRKRIMDQLIEYGLLWEASQFHSLLLKEALSRNRHFDKGDSQSIEIIKDCVKELESSLECVYDEDLLPHPVIDELDSALSPHIQAADWASGIARDIYERAGIGGVKKSFKYVIYNGKIIFD